MIRLGNPGSAEVCLGGHGLPALCALYRYIREQFVSLSSLPRATGKKMLGGTICQFMAGEISQLGHEVE
jgi:hypothetical protein